MYLLLISLRSERKQFIQFKTRIDELFDIYLKNKYADKYLANFVSIVSVSNMFALLLIHKHHLLL